MTINGGDGRGENPQKVTNMIIDQNDTAKKRVRQYGTKNNGPFVVCVRAIEKPLQSMKIIKFLHNTYKSNLITRQINEFKINVIFEPKIDNDENVNIARKEANDFPTTAWNKACRLYIPEIRVEVIGCIAWSPEQETEEIISVGQGKFRNTLMPTVKVLDATRFEKTIDEAGNKQREPTNTVRVIFEGLLLPDYLNVDGLLIPVREFKRKQMFCELCLRYNHTKSHCNNKPHKAAPADKTCIHCNIDDHQTGDKNCPRRKILEKRDKTNIKTTQKKTYAQMLQEIDPTASLNNESIETHFPLNLGTRNERKRHQQHRPGTSNMFKKDTPIKKRRTENYVNDEQSWADETENRSPPGFKNASNINCDDSTSMNDITMIIKNFIIDLGLPPFIENLVLKFVIPVLNKIINQITTSFMVKMSQFGNE